MKRSAIIASAASLLLAGLFSIAPAQAAAGPCFLIMPNPAASPACATAQPRLPAPLAMAPAAPAQRACPSAGASTGGGCLSNQELGQALGTMAAGGMQIAATVMRAVTEEASRLLMSDEMPDMDLR